MESEVMEGDRDDMILGIRSPTMTKYEILTPQHLTAMAKSNNTTNLGKVTLDISKKETVDDRGRKNADLERSKRPAAEKNAHKAMIRTPGIRPTEARACGMASIPAPRSVFEILNTADTGVRRALSS